MSSTFSTLAPSCAKPARLPSALFRSSGAVPEIVFEDSCTQERKAAFVAGSKMRRISSSSTVGSTCEFTSVPPSASSPADGWPGVSSTKVSPSSVFWRRIARVSRGIGANFGSIFRITFVRLPALSSRFERTLPTVTPAIRTSAASASVVASGKLTVSWYSFGLSGTEPPNEIHRNVSSPKHDSAKITIAAIRPRLGPSFCI